MASFSASSLALLLMASIFMLMPLLQSHQIVSKNVIDSSTTKPKSGYLEVDGHSYYVGTEGNVNWFDAQNICRSLNMTLVSLQNKDKNDKIQSALAFNSEYKDSWLWASGFRVMYTDHWYWGSTGEDMVYTRWAENEPDVVNQSSSCTNFKGSFSFWEDNDCDFYVMYFMCE